MFAPVDCNHLVEEAISLTQPKWKTQTEARGIRIRAETDLPEVPLVAGNAADLREALTNLIFNAVDAMPRGGTITISTSSPPQLSPSKSQTPVWGCPRRPGVVV